MSERLVVRLLSPSCLIFFESEDSGSEMIQRWIPFEISWYEVGGAALVEGGEGRTRRGSVPFVVDLLVLDLWFH